MPAQRQAITSQPFAEADLAGGADQSELNLIGVARTFRRDQPIFAEGEGTEAVFKVAAGAVRTFRLLADGRRQITGFFLPGDVFGLDLGATRRESAEAVREAAVIVARRSSLAASPAGALWRHALGELQRSQDHVVTLGRRSATERVVRFLLDISVRVGAPDTLVLPMSRHDIADYLGLTIETVSRALTQLQADGLVGVANCRQLRLLRPAALMELCE